MPRSVVSSVVPVMVTLPSSSMLYVRLLSSSSPADSVMGASSIAISAVCSEKGSFATDEVESGLSPRVSSLLGSCNSEVGELSLRFSCAKAGKGMHMVLASIAATAVRVVRETILG